MKEYLQILDQNEKILWEGNPKFLPFVAKSFITLPFGLFYLLFSIFWTGSAYSMGAPLLFVLFGSPFIIIGALITFGPIIYSTLVYKHVHYLITDKRVIVQGGIVGRDFKTIDFDMIQNAEVNVGIFDKLFGQNSGSINISTAGMITPNTNTIFQSHNFYRSPYTISNVENPYKVFEFLKRTSHNVKTDIEYPNALRPQDNPGYKTKLTAK